MNIKTILCIFGGSAAEANAANAAFQIGKLHNAHIRFLHISPRPAAGIGVYGEGVYATAAMMEAIEIENVSWAKKVKQHVAELAANYGVPIATPEALAQYASIDFVHMNGWLNDAIAQEGRMNDLIILGREIPPARDLVIPALFATGRPVLLMPGSIAGLHTWRANTVAFAWNGGLPAARALYNALPLIENAEILYVLVLREHNNAFDLEAELRLMEYLNMHGFKAKISVIEKDHRSVAKALTDRALELRADLLVMGAYGHSRLREMVLGGVTEYMLEHAEIPLLLSH